MQQSVSGPHRQVASKFSLTPEVNPTILSHLLGDRLKLVHVHLNSPQRLQSLRRARQHTRHELEPYVFN